MPPVNVEPPARRPTLREERAAVTRRRILDAARHRFFEDGYAATTLKAIATEAGVAVQTVYAVFGSKAAMLAELRALAVDLPEADQAGHAAMSEHDARAPPRRLRALDPPPVGTRRRHRQGQPGRRPHGSRRCGPGSLPPRPAGAAASRPSCAASGRTSAPASTSTGRSASSTHSRSTRCTRSSSPSRAGRPTPTRRGSRTRSSRASPSARRAPVSRSMVPAPRASNSVCGVLDGTHLDCQALALGREGEFDSRPSAVPGRRLTLPWATTRTTRRLGLDPLSQTSKEPSPLRESGRGRRAHATSRPGRRERRDVRRAARADDARQVGYPRPRRAREPADAACSVCARPGFAMCPGHAWATPSGPSVSRQVTWFRRRRDAAEFEDGLAPSRRWPR